MTILEIVRGASGDNNSGFEGDDVERSKMMIAQSDGRDIVYRWHNDKMDKG